jgi:hypothetical protein
LQVPGEFFRTNLNGFSGTILVIVYLKLAFISPVAGPAGGENISPFPESCLNRKGTLLSAIMAELLGILLNEVDGVQKGHYLELFTKADSIEMMDVVGSTRIFPKTSNFNLTESFGVPMLEAA